VGTQLNSTTPPVITNLPTNQANVNAPKAYLTVLFFDVRFNFITAANSSQQIQVNPSVGSGGAVLALTNIQAPKNGYVYVYVSNQSDQTVYFDNMQVGVKTGNIIEEDHYYAYRLKIAGISSKKLGDAFEENLKNNNLYNDKELFDDGDINWYDYGYRNYDPQIGRFMQIDPLADDYGSLTPYQYAGNDPIGNSDEDGLSIISDVGKSTTGLLDVVVTNSPRVTHLSAEVRIQSGKFVNISTKTVSQIGKVASSIIKTVQVGVNTVHSKGIVTKTVNFINSDADGSKGAYNKNNSKKALDFSGNAKNSKTGKWSKNVIVFDKGNPKDYGNGDLQAKSSYHLKTKSDSQDTDNYLDSRTYSYFVLSGSYAEENGIELGDIGIVQNLDNGYEAYAIFGDSGPNNFTEGSIHLINSLGHPGFKLRIKDAKNKTIYGHFKFTVFKKSGLGNGNFISQDDINKLGKALKEKFKF